MTKLILKHFIILLLFLFASSTSFSSICHEVLNKDLPRADLGFSPRLVMSSAVNAFNEGNHLASIGFLSIILRANPKDAKALTMFGKNMLFLGHLEIALKAYKKVVAVEGVSLFGLTDIAHTLVQLKKYDEALDIIEEVQKTKPNDIVILQLESRAFEGLKQYDDALSALDDILAIKPEDRRARDSYNRVLDLKMRAERTSN